MSLCAAFIVLLLLGAAHSARAAANVEPDDDSYRWGTQQAFDSYCSTTGNGSSECGPSLFTTFLPDYSTGAPPSGAYAYTSDYAFGSLWQILDASVGEQFTWVVTCPNGTTETIGTLTYDGTTSLGSGCWSDSSGWEGCDSLTPGSIFNYGWGVFPGCANPQSATGQWTMAVYDNGVLAAQQNPDGTITTWQPVPFAVSHGGQVGIGSPTENQLFDLDQNNFTETDNVTYSATANTGNPISWAATLSYKTSKGFGATSLNLPVPTTASGDEAYQSEGGQVNVTASTTASDGSTVRDCVTYYIDGPQTGIPDATITGQLETSHLSYPSSKS